MNFYIVVNHHHAGKDIIGVYGSEELALRKLEEFKSDDVSGSESYSIEEHEVEYNG